LVVCGWLLRRLRLLPLLPSFRCWLQPVRCRTKGDETA
jgi:hypothetical protein